MAGISKKIQDAIASLSKKYDYDSAVLEKEITAIMASKGLEEIPALREWKNTHKWIAYTKDHNYMVFGLSEAATVTIKRGTPDEEQKEVSNASILVDVDGDLKTYTMSFWDEDVDKINELSINQCYVSRLSLNKKGYASAIGGKITPLTEQVIPKFDDLKDNIEYVSVDDLASKAGETVFYKGDIVDWVEKDGATIGVKIDSLTGFPVTVLFSGFDAPDESLESVRGFGRVTVKDNGDVTVYSSIVF